MTLMHTVELNHEFIFQKASIINQDVEFLGIINERGKLIESIGKDCFDMSNGNKEMFFMKIVLRSKMQKDFDEYLGSVNYCMTQRGGKKFISIPVYGNKVILAVTKNDFDHEALVNDITQTLKYSEQFLNEKFQKEVN